MMKGKRETNMAAEKARYIDHRRQEGFLVACNIVNAITCMQTKSGDFRIWYSTEAGTIHELLN